MTHVTTLVLDRWKGRTLSVPIGRLNLLTGVNGSGKTAVLEALRFACTGKTSAGGLNDDTRQLVAHDGGGVDVTLSDGFRWRRSLVIDHEEATISQRCTVHDGVRRRLNESKTLVSEHVGDFAPMFDLGAFTRLSANGRRDFVMALCGEVAGVSQTVTDSVVGMREVLPGGPYDSAILSDASKRLTDSYARAGSPVDGLAAALELCRDEINAAARIKDEGHAAARQLSQRINEIQVAAGTLTEMRDEERRLDTAIVSLAATINTSRGRAEALDSLQQQIAQQRSYVEGYERRIAAINAEPVPDGGEAARMREQVVNLQAEADAIEMPDTSRELLFRAEQARDEAHCKLRDAERVSETAAYARKTLQVRIDTEADDPWRRAGDMLKLGVETMGSCEPFVELAHYIELRTTATDPDSLKVHMAAAKEELKTAQMAACAAEEHHTEAHQLVDEHDTEHKAALRLREERDSERMALTERAHALGHAADAIGTDAKLRTANLSDAAAKALECRATINQLEQRIAMLGETAPNTEIETQHAETKDRRVLLRERIDAKGRADTLERDLADAKLASLRLEQRWRIYTEFRIRIREMREKIMAEIVSPLLTRMDRFINAAMPGFTAYCRLTNARDNPIFEMGWSDGTTQYPFDTLPGGYKAIYSCALAYALAAVADVPLRFVLCEVAEVDAQNLSRLIDGFEAVQGELSNVLLATHLPIEVAGDWNIIRCVEAVEGGAGTEVVGA